MQEEWAMSIGETHDLEPQVVTKSASTCRWAVPTLSREGPEWLEAENSPWTCARDNAAHVLETTEPCEACPHWEARRASNPGEGREQSSEQRQGADAVPTADWFEAGPKPHETT